MEITLRVFWAPPVDTRGQFLLEHDPLYGWRKINSKSIRGPEYSYEKKSKEYRVLVLGDSHAEGYRVEFQDLFSEYLKKRLNKTAGSDTEVINAGTSGYSTDQELLFFENEGKKYHPDLTILIFSPDNIWYNCQTVMSYWQKPRFQLKEGQLHLTNVPVPKPEEPVSYRMRQFLKKNSYVSKFFYEKIIHAGFYTWLSQMGLTPFPDSLRVWQKNQLPPVREAWQLIEALLVKFEKDVESSGSHFLVFYVPLPASVYPEVWKEKREKYAMSELEWDPIQDSRELEAICRRNGIDFLNPVWQFRTAAERLSGRGKKLYSFEDDHWTVDGHQLAGKILTKYFKENYLIKAERG